MRAFRERRALPVGLFVDAIRTADVDDIVGRMRIALGQCATTRVARRIAALRQIVVDRYALIEDETLAVETTVGAEFTTRVEIVEDSAVELIDLGEPAIEQIRTRLLATNSACLRPRTSTASDPPTWYVTLECPLSRRSTTLPTSKRRRPMALGRGNGCGV